MEFYQFSSFKVESRFPQSIFKVALTSLIFRGVALRVWVSVKSVPISML